MAEDEIKGNTKTANLQLTRFDLHYDNPSCHLLLIVELEFLRVLYCGPARLGYTYPSRIRMCAVDLSIHCEQIQSLDLFARLIPAYGFGVVRLCVQPNRCTFVQSRAKRKADKATIRSFGCSVNF